MQNARSWILLFLSIGLELIATTCLKLSEGFTVIPFVAMCFLAYAACFFFFTKCLESMSLALAYGIWGGIGTVGTIIIGMVVWSEPFTLLMGLGVICVIVGTGLMAAGEHEE